MSTRAKTKTSQDAPRVMPCDFFVAGGGIAGICAAVQAGRLGLRTILAEKEMFLGGNGGPNLGVGATGAHVCNPGWNETGIVEELEERVNFHGARLYPTNFAYNIHPLWDDVVQRMLDEAGVTVLRRHLVLDARRRGHHLRGVTLLNIENLDRIDVRVEGYALDATGDAVLAVLAGADWTMGREGRQDTGERAAPECADALVSAASVTALVVDTGRASVFVPPPDTPPWNPEKPDNHFNPNQAVHFLWQVDEGGGDNASHPLYAPQELHRRLVRRIFSVWNYLKNVKYPVEARNFQLVWISPILGRRESRRVLGDTLLSETDIAAGRVFPDAVGFGGACLDEHLPSHDGGYEVRFILPPLPYDIPLRCLYSRAVPNLFVGGRAIGVSHLAFTSTRLMRTGGMLGQAVAVAAALCHRKGLSPRQLAAEHTVELQRELIRADVWVIGVDGRDPDDLAQHAVVTASSEAQASREAVKGTWCSARHGRAAALHTYGPTVEKVSFYVRNPSTTAHTVTAFLAYGETPPTRLLPVPPVRFNDRTGRYEEVRGQKDDPVLVGAGDATEPVGSQGWAHYARRQNDVLDWKTVDKCRLPVPAGFQGWLEVPLTHAGFPDFDRRIVAQAVVAGLRGPVQILCAPHPLDTIEGRAGLPGGTWRVNRDASPVFRITPDPVPGRCEQILDGCIHREGRARMHQWISAPEADLPQWVRLDFEEPVVFDEILLRFDVTELFWQDLYTLNGGKTAARCVADYRIEVAANHRWKTVVHVTDNFLRFRTHRLAEPVCAGRVRLVVERLWGAGLPARLYELRLYHAGTASAATPPSRLNRAP